MLIDFSGLVGIAKDYITPSAAFVGAVLGVVNTLHNFNQKRVKLRVVPSMSTIYPSRKTYMCINVVNLSAFPVTVSEVGLVGRWANPEKSLRAMVPMPKLIDGGSWPRRLESREVVAALVNPSEIPDDLGKVYAKTSCGVFVCGRHRGFSGLVAKIKEHSKNS